MVATGDRFNPGILLFVWFLVAFFYMSYVVYQRKPGQLAPSIIVGSTAGVLAYVASGTLDVVTLGAKPHHLVGIGGPDRGHLAANAPCANGASGVAEPDSCKRGHTVAVDQPVFPTSSALA